jgi:hypothetical protein
MAPDEKRDKVLREIKRPAFSHRGPLSEVCSFLLYGTVEAVSKMMHLAHMSDCILEEFEESAEEV